MVMNSLRRSQDPSYGFRRTSQTFRRAPEASVTGTKPFGALRSTRFRGLGGSHHPLDALQRALEDEISREFGTPPRAGSFRRATEAFVPAPEASRPLPARSWANA